MAVSAGDILEVSVVHTINNIDEQINVLHFQAGVVVDGSEAAVDADLWEHIGDCYTMIEDRTPDELNMVELRWRNLTDDGPTRYYPWHGTYTGGTSTADPLPPGNSCLIVWRTGVKRVTGRTYLPVFTESQQSNGIWEAGTLGDVAAFATALSDNWLGGASSNEYDMRVWSKTLGSAHQIIGAQVKPQVAYMRRRRFGRGS